MVFFWMEPKHWISLSCGHYKGLKAFWLWSYCSSYHREIRFKQLDSPRQWLFTPPMTHLHSGSTCLKSLLSDFRLASSCVAVLTCDQSCVSGVVELSLGPSHQLANPIHKNPGVTVQSCVVSLEAHHASHRRVGTARKLKMYNERLSDCCSGGSNACSAWSAGDTRK